MLDPGFRAFWVLLEAGSSFRTFWPGQPKAGEETDKKYENLSGQKGPKSTISGSDIYWYCRGSSKITPALP